MDQSKTVILGLGNAMMSDDGIGLIIVQKLAEQVHAPDLEFKVSEKVGLNLIELLLGYDRAIIIDSIITGERAPGEIIECSLDDLPSSPRLRCPHDADFKSAVELARRTGLKMPEKILILGVEAVDIFNFTPDLSPQLAERMPEIVAEISTLIKSKL